MNEIASRANIINKDGQEQMQQLKNLITIGKKSYSRWLML